AISTPSTNAEKGTHRSAGAGAMAAKPSTWMIGRGDVDGGWHRCTDADRAGDTGPHSGLES
ncbi:MAG: hypothetical protein M3P18_00715, partial [Actinomycetota bacterium]|nr:hypothetical protein [Actinomycetota bacterium]